MKSVWFVTFKRTQCALLRENVTLSHEKCERYLKCYFSLNHPTSKTEFPCHPLIPACLFASVCVCVFCAWAECHWGLWRHQKPFKGPECCCSKVSITSLSPSVSIAWCFSSSSLFLFALSWGLGALSPPSLAHQQHRDQTTAASVSHRLELQARHGSDRPQWASA